MDSDNQKNIESMDLTVQEIASACGGRLVRKEDGAGDNRVRSVVIDSRKVEEGSVFVATLGERVDGHSFIASAYAKGAVLAVTQKTPEQVAGETGQDTSCWGDYLLVEDTLEALRAMAEYYRQKVGIPVVGITGSVGKTSTKECIAGVLAEKYTVWKTEGNYNNTIGVPLTLLGIRPCHQVAVVEMGISDFGEMHLLSRMARPNVCVITNIGQSHLENLGSREGILQAKSEIFDYMAPDGEICLNAEDDILCTLEEIRGRKPHFFGLGRVPWSITEASHTAGFKKLIRDPFQPKEDPPVDTSPIQEVSALDIVHRGLKGSDATLYILRDGKMTRFPVHMPLPGRHMVLNAAAAACVATLFQVTPEQIQEGIRKLTAVDGRSHIIKLDNFTIIDDCYNANPASMKVGLDILAQEEAPTRRTAILGDMFELGEDSVRLHEEVAEYAVETGIEHIIFVGEQARHMFRAADRKIGIGRRGELVQHIYQYPTVEDCIEDLAVDAEYFFQKGCTILLKASHGMEFTKILDFLKSIPALPEFR